MSLQLGANKQKIFLQFLYNERLRFSKIQKQTRIPSNLLAYFLKKMIAEGMLEMRAKTYKLTPVAEKLIPFYVKDEKMISPLAVVLPACLSKDGKKVLLIKRDKRPYKGFWSLLSGRLLINESIGEAAQRVMREKAFCKIIVGGIKSVVYERLIEDDLSKHGFVFFLVEARVIDEKQFNEKEFLKWFDISKLKKREVIASDYWMIKEKLLQEQNIEVVEETVNEHKKTTKMNLS